MAEKIRLDTLLVEQGFETSRERAKATIMSGIVFVNNQKADKAGELYTREDKIEVRGKTLQYVSRGGLKLEKALSWFEVDPTGMHCVDIGASTGGFTDVLLKNGADKVYSVDVGYGQLAWSLRNDPRVVCMERTNFRHVTHEQIPEELDLAVCDVSFISLKLILPAVAGLLKENGQMLTLIKPQFEAGREKVGKKGVVRDPETHKEVLDHFVALADSLDFTILGLTFSPVKGPEGNIEFLGHLCMEQKDGIRPDTADIVRQAHETLKG
jgi:23S rRNA (cytidine1920-2'-O)/16S rRNA (cytidine1409-2'-O)-methyltransferase